ncbi:hypothetical protein Hamer_G026248 [Homarus americanus]|uniref:Uncharacterized protein n=1 Tax=Homarus americanus TaxID=6706 RepID=A0A8J5TKF2_HOMAM|nr:hypothetical protein Hamer_G026248 [Homarus americanus]
MKTAGLFIVATIRKGSGLTVHPPRERRPPGSPLSPSHRKLKPEFENHTFICDSFKGDGEELWYITHQYITHQYNTHQYITQYNTHQYITHQYNTHQYNTHQYNTHQYITHQYITHQYNTHQYNTHQYNTHQYITHQYITHQYITHQYITHQSHHPPVHHPPVHSPTSTTPISTSPTSTSPTSTTPTSTTKFTVHLYPFTSIDLELVPYDLILYCICSCKGFRVFQKVFDTECSKECPQHRSQPEQAAVHRVDLSVPRSWPCVCVVKQQVVDGSQHPPQPLNHRVIMTECRPSSGRLHDPLTQGHSPGR